MLNGLPNQHMMGVLFNLTGHSARNAIDAIGGEHHYRMVRDSRHLISAIELPSTMMEIRFWHGVKTVAGDNITWRSGTQQERDDKSGGLHGECSRKRFVSEGARLPPFSSIGPNLTDP